MITKAYDVSKMISTAERIIHKIGHHSGRNIQNKETNSYVAWYILEKKYIGKLFESFYLFIYLFLLL